MDIIPPEAAHVMSIASANPGSGPLMPTNNALPSSAPVLVVSPAILGTEDKSEKEKESIQSTGMSSAASPGLASLASSMLGATTVDSSNDKDTEIELRVNSEHQSKDNIALPLRRPSTDVSKPTTTAVSLQDTKTMVATSLSESNANNAVETFVTTTSSSEKPQHVILQNNKPPSPKAQSPSAEGFNQTKTSIQVHTPSTSSKSSHSVGSSVLISERENNRPLPNPIKSGGQKVTLVTRQNDPDHVSFVLNPSTCSSSEIIAANAASVAKLTSSPDSTKEASEVDGSKLVLHDTGIEASTENVDNLSSSTSISTANSSSSCSKKGKKQSRKSPKEYTNIANKDELDGSIGHSRKSRKALKKSTTENQVILSPSANNKDVIKGDTVQTKEAISVSQCQKAQSGSSSYSDILDGSKRECKQEIEILEDEKVKSGKETIVKKDLSLPLIENNNHETLTTNRSIIDSNRRVCSGDIELVPANVMNNSILPEKEEYQIELTKDEKGLGITVAGYICEKGKILQNCNKYKMFRLNNLIQIISKII